MLAYTNAHTPECTCSYTHPLIQHTTLKRFFPFRGGRGGRERRWVGGGEVVHNPFKCITQPVISGLTSWPVQQASIKPAHADLLLIVADAQISDSLDGVLDMSLLVGLDVDVAFQSLLGHHRLDLQRLESKDGKQSHPCKRKSCRPAQQNTPCCMPCDSVGLGVTVTICLLC